MARTLGSRFAAAAVVAGVMAVWLLPSFGEPPQRIDSFTDRTEVSAVLLSVTVRDRRGRLVPTLDKAQFRLFVDGVQYPIDSFWREAGLPLSLAFVVDVSGSMGTRRLEMAGRALTEFSSQLQPRDEAALITFGGGEVKRRLRFGGPVSSIPGILGRLRAFGTTNLYDVLTVAPQLTEDANHIRRAILLFTDGVDTASSRPESEALRVLEGVTDPLYVFGIEPPPNQEGETYETILSRLATASGGRYIPVSEAAKLPLVARQLRQELTMRYIIAIQPSRIGLVQWRDVRVTVDGSHTATTRKGYVGTLP
jgi:Ca-activated chloride channel homolog